MPVRGPRQIVGSTAEMPTGGLVRVTPPSLQIIVPDIAASPLQREWSIRFVWGPEATDAHRVTDFELSDISITPTTITLSDFFYEDNTAEVLMTLPDNILDAAEITVAADAANFRGQAVPEDAVVANFMFDTRRIPDPSIGTVVCERSFGHGRNTDLNSVLQMGEFSGGAYKNVLEIKRLGGYVYLVVMIQKWGNIFGNVNAGAHLTEFNQAGAALYRVETSTCTFELLKAYPSVTLAARSLQVKDNRLYFFEGSHYAYLNEGSVTLLDDEGEVSGTEYRQSRLAGVPDDWKGQIGHLFSIANTEMAPTNHGLTAVSATASDSPYDTTDRYYGVHGGTASPMIDDGDLNVISGYGVLERIEDAKNEVSRGGNWQRVKFSDDLRMKVPILSTNEQTGFDVIKELATLSNSIVGFDNDTFFFMPRDPLTATLNQDIPIGYNMGVIAIEDLGTAFAEYPTTGMFLIGQELFSYTSMDSDTILAFSRQQNSTPEQMHSTGDTLTWIDHYLSLNNWTLNQPIDDINIVNDTQNIYNRITVNYDGGQYGPIPDDASIATYGILPLTVTVALGTGNLGWIKWIAERLLERYKQPATLIDLDLQWSQHLKVADTVYVYVKDRVNLQRACQVISVNHDITIDENGTRAATRVKLLGI